MFASGEAIMVHHVTHSCTFTVTKKSLSDGEKVVHRCENALQYAHLLVCGFLTSSSTWDRLHALTAAPPFSMCGRPRAAKCTPQ